MTWKGRFLAFLAALFGTMFAGMAVMMPAVREVCLWIVGVWFLVGLLSLRN